MGWYYYFISAYCPMYGHETIGGYLKNQFIGAIKITVAKEMRSTRDYLDQGKMPMSK